MTTELDRPWTQEVVEQAIAVVDHLCAYNDKNHPVVHAALLRLATVVDNYLNRRPAPGSTPAGHEEGK